MSERKMQPTSSETRRLLFYVVSLSIFLLIFSCFTLWRSNNTNSQIPESVLMLMLVNNTSALSNNGGSSKSTSHLESLVTHPTYVQNTNPLSNIQVDFKQNSQDRKVCDPNQAMLKVFMYDLPPEFHFGLLGWKGKSGQTWPDVSDVNCVPNYPGRLNLQHSMEYWLTLDLLASDYPGVSRPCTAVRVHDSSISDVVFVPFFSSVSYNRHSKLHGNKKISRDTFLQDKLVKFLRNQEEWKVSGGGRNHLIMAHHPNSLLDARRQLGSAIFLLADFGRYPHEIANIKKDIVAPYKHVVKSIGNGSAPFKARPLLAYFHGAIIRKDGGMIRQELYHLLKDEKDVHFAYGTVAGNGIYRAGKGMASSRFCLNIAGDTPSSNRLFDAIASHCVPVIVSDEIELPFEDVINYSDFAIFVQAPDAIREGYLLNLLRGINGEQWTQMWRRLKEVAHHFEYQYPSKYGDAVEMIWRAVARKLPAVQLSTHKKNRFRRSQI